MFAVMYLCFSKALQARDHWCQWLHNLLRLSILFGNAALFFMHIMFQISTISFHVHLSVVLQILLQLSLLSQYINKAVNDLPFKRCCKNILIFGYLSVAPSFKNVQMTRQPVFDIVCAICDQYMHGLWATYDCNYYINDLSTANTLLNTFLFKLYVLIQPTKALLFNIPANKRKSIYRPTSVKIIVVLGEYLVLVR